MKSIFYHILFLIFLIIILCLSLSNKFFNGTYTLIHDNYYWTLPAFRFWYDSLSLNTMPLFDFFSNGGVPFYPLIIQLRFLDPIDLIITFILIKLNIGIVSAFNARYLIICIINAYFLYLIISKYLNNKLSKNLLLIILLLSSFIPVTFRQPGFILLHQWTGIILYSVYMSYYSIKINNANIFNIYTITGLFFISNTFWGYSFSGIALFFICFFIVHYKNYQIIFNKKIIILIILIIPALPTMVVFNDRGSFVYPAREPSIINVNGESHFIYSQYEPKETNIYDSNLVQNYKVLKETGVYGNISDFITLFSPIFNSNISPNSQNIIYNSEAYYFYGLIILFFMPLGFIYFLNHTAKLSYIFLLLLLFYLGPKYYFHQLIYSLFPPISVFRHSILITLFLQSFLILFCVKGFDLILDLILNKDIKKYIRLNHFYRRLNFNFIKNDNISVLHLFLFSILLIFSLYISLLFFVDKFQFNYLFLIAFIFVFTLYILIHLNLNTLSLKIFIYLVASINFAQLIYETNNIAYLYSDKNLFNLDKSEKLYSKEANHRFIFESAKLSSNCYYGVTSQVIRYPSLLNYERNLFSPIVLTQQEINDGFKSNCENFNEEMAFLSHERWNSLLFYKTYFNDINKNLNFINDRRFFLRDNLYISNFSKINSNSIEFNNTSVGILKTNLYFDLNWKAYCDDSEITINDKFDLIQLTLNTSCNKLELKYYPTLFIYCIFLLCIYYLLFIALILFFVVRYFKIQSSVHVIDS